MSNVLVSGNGTPDELGREVWGEWDALYWAYNCPLQMWHSREGSKSVWRVVNYMPRKEAADEMETRVTEDELATFCGNASKTLRNLADLFDALGRREIDMIYYPDKTVAEAIRDRSKD